MSARSINKAFQHMRDHGYGDVAASAGQSWVWAVLYEFQDVLDEFPEITVQKDLRELIADLHTRIEKGSE